MPFLSLSQRRKFFALKSQGKMDQATIDKWEAATPKDKKLPERLHKKAMSMKHFWTGFEKKAVESYVSANPAMEYPGAPEKMLKWNDKGGVDPRSPEELQSAEGSKMVTLPSEVEGATCATCMHFRPLTPKLGHGFCTNPEIKMDVTENMHCMHWENPESHDPIAAAEEEAQEAEAEQAVAAQQGMGPQGQPGMDAQPGQPGQEQPQQGKGIPSGAPQQGMDQMGASAQPQEAQPSEGTGQPYKSSPVASQSGFPQGPQTSQNPLVEQAVQDFQGSGATGGPTGGDGGDIGSAKPKKPAAKSDSKSKSDSKDSKSGGKGHTININVEGKSKTASMNFWKGVVDGY